MAKIKICGLSRVEDIIAVNQAMPDYIGFVFAKSRRQVNMAQAKELKNSLNKGILSVGVFVNAEIKEITALCREGIIEVIQLHGDEDENYISALKKEISQPIIKAIRVQSMKQILAAQELSCDYLLLDTYDKNLYGGSGKSFDWSIIPRLSKEFFLAGGLDISNLKTAQNECQPYCLDISSGVETNGIKDREKINAAVKIVRGEL